MYKWEKLGLIFNPASLATPEWMFEYAQAPAVLVLESFVRVYFSTRPPADKSGQFVSHAAYVDLDRSDLTRILAISDEPVLSLGEIGTFDEFGTYPISVIRDQGKVIAYYGGWTRCESVPFNVAIGVAESNDGGSCFRKLGSGGPVLSYSPDEPFIVSGPKIRRFDGRWYLFYIAGRKWITSHERPEPVYKIRMAYSDDGLNWSKLGKDIIESVLNEDECQASPDVIFYNGAYHMFFCYRESLGYKSKSKGYRIGYARSEDLVHWERNDELVGIDVSGDGWDSEMVSYPHVFELDDSINMLYLGNNFGQYGFGLARLVGEL